MIDTSMLDGIIIGRVDPHIYAFTTNTIPNYLKVGDTYRPVSVRLQEWREHFPELEKQFEDIAKVADDVYFRDHAVHSFLEQDKGRIRLQRADIPETVYYSKEFFKSASTTDVEEAISEIKRDYQDGSGRFQFYNADTRLPETHTYERIDTYEPRPNQCATIRAFKEAVEAGRTNLLMYAVMRFGKSFTAMCCAVEMVAKLVVAVSAKADVREEWKKTVESHRKFADYDFIDGDALFSDENAIHTILASGRRAFVFLTLQDLQGDFIKDKHREIFGNEIDLLIVDETHFGARAEKYGAVLRERPDKDVAEKLSPEEKLTLDSFVEHAKTLSAKVRLHLSGTPYRILMGSEFTKDDIIAFYQFSDIVKDQEAWIADNNRKDKPKEEWENPYYGFPQMIRFAFYPNASSRRRLAELKKSGTTYAFSALFKPQSIKKADDGSHKKFVFEQEILELLEVIDGSREDGELLGFLDYDKIKEGKMCRHIVCVLPYCAACDALEALIRGNSDKFKNLNEYEIINISGVDNPTRYRRPDDIKSAIRNCEREQKKTITLTVNRMLTGSTVEEWDTMLFLKDTASPQEYDQAIFRLQSQYIKKFVDAEGHTIKYNMKPQTLLVDFDPDRLFVMQEQKAQIYNVNVDEAGNTKLQERLAEELRISPIVVMNANKIERVKATDILQAVSNYSRSRGVAEETTEIPVDLALKDIEEIWEVIGKENELGSKSGFTSDAHQGEGGGSDMDTGDQQDDADNDDNDAHNEGQATGRGEAEQQDKDKNDPVKQFRSYYARILFYSFLTKDQVASLEGIIATMEMGDNVRIAHNIGIHKPVLEGMLSHMNRFVLRDLDYKIQNINMLSRDDTLSPIERASVAVQKIGKLGDSEVITPAHVCDEMVDLLPDECLTALVGNEHKILDISSKVGEFAIALCKRFENLGYKIESVKSSIYSIPTSSMTYEFTRKVYEELGLDVSNIAGYFTSYDLLKVTTEDGKVNYGRIAGLLKQRKAFHSITLGDTPTNLGDETVTFDAIVGNPPYQERSIGDNKGYTPPIYDKFLDVAYALSEHVVMIHPARFLFNAGSTPKEWNKKMLESNNIRLISYESDATKVFSETSITGGVAITVYDKSKQVSPIGIYVPYEELNSIRKKVVDYEGFTSISSIMSGRTPYLFTDVFHRENPNAIKLLSNGHMYDVSSNAFLALKNVFMREKPMNHSDYFRILGRLNGTRAYCWIKKSYVRGRLPEYVNTWKVFLPKANGASGMLGEEPARIISKPAVGNPDDIATDTFICVGSFTDEAQAKALYKYLNGRFSRILLGILKVTQDNTSDKWAYVPLQDFSDHSDIDWTLTIPEVDKQLYEKYGLTAEEIDFIESKIAPME